MSTRKYVNIPVATRTVLLRAMEWWSEDRWCAGWLQGLHEQIPRAAQSLDYPDEDAKAISAVAAWLDGWWVWDDAAGEPRWRPNA